MPIDRFIESLLEAMESTGLLPVEEDDIVLYYQQLLELYGTQECFVDEYCWEEAAAVCAEVECVRHDLHGNMGEYLTCSEDVLYELIGIASYMAGKRLEEKKIPEGRKEFCTVVNAQLLYRIAERRQKKALEPRPDTATVFGNSGLKEYELDFLISCGEEELAFALGNTNEIPRRFKKIADKEGIEL